MMESENLKLILCQIAVGDENAFRFVFTKYSGKVYTYALKLTHTTELAQEIVQEVFVKIWIGREKLVTIDCFPSYLYCITKNHALNQLKRLSVEQKIKIAFNKQSAATADERSPVSEHENTLRGAIDRLPPQQQLVYKMCYHDGLKYDEVAKQLSISRFTVKTHMQQALKSIRSTFEALK